METSPNETMADERSNLIHPGIKHSFAKGWRPFGRQAQLALAGNKHFRWILLAPVNPIKAGFVCEFGNDFSLELFGHLDRQAAAMIQVRHDPCWLHQRSALRRSWNHMGAL